MTARHAKRIVIEQPVHDAFGLTYASYLVVPRLVLQAMPVAWQRKFVALLEQLPDTPVYSVQRRDPCGRFIPDPLADYRHGHYEIRYEIETQEAT